MALAETELKEFGALIPSFSFNTDVLDVSDFATSISLLSAFHTICIIS